jgi:peptidoglycan/LPS O-acetylase OafA/YrhL
MGYRFLGDGAPNLLLAVAFIGTVLAGCICYIVLERPLLNVIRNPHPSDRKANRALQI